ncbi:hypothetical protein F5Y15DRAFT_409544 [Xylariaceae sp. FL0016]|nr:hypothetical protein F5Y15DRAFT_409544 [Xylariaceae sp. FL0016]
MLPDFRTTHVLSATTPSGASGSVSSPNFAWKPDEFVLDQGYQEFREELRGLIFNAAHSTAPTREGSPVVFAAGAQDAPGPSSHHESSFSSDRHVRRETAKILAVGNRINYLRSYISQVAPWLDMFDSDRAFGLQLPAIARTSPALLYAILGISARQVERKEGRKDAFDSIELYQEAIKLLPPLLLDRNLISVPICVILCCLEMMSASAQDWRRHLEGCAALFINFGVHGFNGGLLQAVFWCYTRMDVCAALISDGTESTLVLPAQWLPPGTEYHQARQLFLGSHPPEMHANYSVWLSSRACELVSERTRFRELGEQNGCTGQQFIDQWIALWEELQDWVKKRPIEFEPISEVDTKPFPQVLYPHWAAISSSQLQHTSCLLLLGIMPKPPKLDLGIAGSPVWHAKRICGISLANKHAGCLNNAIQPLWLAGRLLSHRSEHDIIIRLIWGIEMLTGWGTRWRIPDLESTWGYKIRRT